MSDKILKKSEIGLLLDRLRSAYRPYAPAKQGTAVDWKPLDRAEDLCWAFGNTDMSPKEFFFPQTERLMHFNNDPEDPKGRAMQAESERDFKQALIGIRPCDAKAFRILDRVFGKTESACDPYWQDKREKTLLIGLACKEPHPSCFCTSMQCGPHHREGLDVLMTDLDEQVLLTGLTDKGEALITEFSDAPAEFLEQAEQQKQAAEKSIWAMANLDNIASRDLLELYDAGFWDRLNEPCLTCGTCTFFCPVCHCFDIQDETQGKYGHRIRNWDTCMSRLFTLHTSGHNPRVTQKDRVRQRFMHKFKYMPMKLEGAAGCVGCGRCIQRCPVNLDVREVIDQMGQVVCQEPV